MNIKSTFVASLILLLMVSSVSASGNDGPVIDSVRVTNGGEKGYIDNDDTILVSFDEDIDLDSIGSNLKISVSSSGLVTIEDVASFDMGDVSESGSFDSTVHKNGDNIRVTLKDGNQLKISEEDFGEVTQISGKVKNEDGVEARSVDNLDAPVGTFGGSQESTGSSSSDSDSDDIGDVWGIQQSDAGFDDLVNINTLGGVYMGFTPFKNMSLLSISITGGLAITFIVVGILGLLGMAGVGAVHPNIKKGWDYIRGAQGKIVAIGIVFSLSFFMIILVFFTLTIFGKVIVLMA